VYAYHLEHQEDKKKKKYPLYSIVRLRLFYFINQMRISTRNGSQILIPIQAEVIHYKLTEEVRNFIRLLLALKPLT
jgi:hypothetical protein